MNDRDSRCPCSIKSPVLFQRPPCLQGGHAKHLKISNLKSLYFRGLPLIRERSNVLDRLLLLVDDGTVSMNLDALLRMAGVKGSFLDTGVARAAGSAVAGASDFTTSVRLLGSCD